MSLRPSQPSSRHFATQSLTLGSSAGASTSVFGSQTYAIRVACTQAAQYLVSASPSVSSTVIAAMGALLPSGAIEHVSVSPGERLSAITSSTAALMTISETCT